MDLTLVLCVSVCLCSYGGLYYVVHGEGLSEEPNNGLSDKLSDELSDGLNEGLGDGVSEELSDGLSDGIVPSDVVARARCAANCYEKYGYLPDHVDAGGYYEIADSFCPDERCEQCLIPCNRTFVSFDDCTQDCLEDPVCVWSCTRIWNEVLDAKHAVAKPTPTHPVRILEPRVVCMNVGSGCFPNKVYMYLTWFVTSHVTVGHVLYAVEARQRAEFGDGVSNTDWTLVKTVPSTFVKIEGLSCRTLYQFRTTPISISGMQGSPVISDWIMTYSETTELVPPYSFTVTDQRLQNQKPSITVEWDALPGGSCNFKLYRFGKELVSPAEIRAPWKLQYNLTGLTFSTNYTLKIHGADDRFLRTSDRKRHLDVATPDCLQSTGYNHSVCAPLPPRNLSVHILTDDVMNPRTEKVNITFSWMPPIGTNGGSDITMYHVSYWKEPPTFGAKHSKPDHGIVNVTDGSSVELYNLHNHNLYIFSLRAESIGGKGNPIKIGAYVGYHGNMITLLSLKNRTFESATTAPIRESSSPITFSVAELVAVVVVPVVILLAVMIVVLRLRRRSRGNKRRYLETRQLGPVEEMNPIYEGVPLFSETGTGKILADSYEIDYSCLDFISVIGEGAFGKVVKAEFYHSPEDRGKKAGKIVAVKMLKDFYTGDESRNFVLEIQAMKNLGSHPYILGILGCCLTGPKLCLVMDYCALGDLRNYLRKYREKLMYNISTPYGLMTKTDTAYADAVLTSDSGASPPTVAIANQDGHDESEITEAQLLSYARQITMGMEFLEQKKFIHRDLAARNILLYDKRHVKISDFGLTRDVYETNVYQPTSARKLPYKWMALESLFSQRFTTKSDVWAFGIVLWEIVTLGGSPYPSIPLQDLYGLLNDGYRMERPENCSKQVYKIMLSCWHPNPNSRPSFQQLRGEIESLLEETQSYIDLSVEVSGDYFNESTNNSQVDIPQPRTPETDTTTVPCSSNLDVHSDTLGAYLDSQKLVVDIHDEPKHVDDHDHKRSPDPCEEDSLLPRLQFESEEIGKKYPDAGLYCVFKFDNNKKWSTSERMLQTRDYSNSNRSLQISVGSDVVKPSLKDNIKSIIEKVGLTFASTPKTRRRSVSLSDNKVTSSHDSDFQLRSSVSIL